jgi:hypothetical protein
MKILAKSLSLEQAILNLDLNAFTKWCTRNQLEMPVKRIDKDRLLGRGKHQGEALFPLRFRLEQLVVAYLNDVHPYFIDLKFQACPDKPAIGYYVKLPMGYSVFFLDQKRGVQLLTARTWASWRTKAGLRKGSATWRKMVDALGLHTLLYPQS